MTDYPTTYVVTVDGDTSDPDYTGVTKRITATGAQYQIVGPLAAAIKSSADEIERLRAALATARRDALEEALKLADPGEKPCDCIRCYCDNLGDAEAMASWCAANQIHSAIRVLKDRTP
jgi:hypothetical protein